MKATKKDYPFFMRKGYKNGVLHHNIKKKWDYGPACNEGKAGAYDFIRYCCENEYCGGELQGIVLAFAEDLPEHERGFIVGMFSQLEILLRDAYAKESVRSAILTKYLNDASRSPLSFHGRDGE